MLNEINYIFLAFIPLFVAIDALGLVPLYISLTNDIDNQQKKKLVTESTLTALAISIIFLFGGRMIFNYLGITADDFRIGGGIVLLVLAVNDLMASAERGRVANTSIGIVPIGIPLIIGPAALTTLLILVDTYGYLVTVISLIANIFFVWLILQKANFVNKVIGDGGTKAFSKVATLFMAAIAIMMIRVGITNILGGK